MKRVGIYFSLLVFLFAGIYCVSYMAVQPPTYNGSGLDVAALLDNPQQYDTSGADGVSAVIVKETMGKTKAVNVVTAILFDFRGYDTMGEAFILFTAISGCLVLLRKSKTKEGGADGTED